MRSGSCRLIPLAVFVTGLIVVAGCGGDAVPAKAKVANPPDLSLATAIFEHGVRATSLTPTDSTQLLDVVLAGNGLVASERACAAAKLLPLLQPDPQGSVRVSAFGKVSQRLRPGSESTAMAQAVAGCVGPESAARIKAKTASPDRDLTGVKALAVRISTAEATAVGFTSTEANCFATHFLSGVPIEQVAAIFSGTMTGTPSFDPRAAVADCVDAERLAALAVQARKDADAYEQCVKDVSAEISKQISDAAAASSTTTPGATPGATTDATTTTIRQCT